MRNVYGTVLLLLALLLSGCPEAAYRMNEAVGYNCRPETIRQYGSCTLTGGTQK